MSKFDSRGRSSDRDNDHNSNRDPSPQQPGYQVSANFERLAEAFEAFREKAALPQAGAVEFFDAFHNSLDNVEAHPAIALWAGALLGHSEQGREYLALCLDSEAPVAGYISAFFLGLQGEDATDMAVQLAAVAQDESRTEHMRVLSRWALGRILPDSNPLASFQLSMAPGFSQATGDMAGVLNQFAGKSPTENELQEAFAALAVSTLLTGNHLFQPFQSILQLDSEGTAETRQLLSRSLLPEGDLSHQLEKLAVGVRSRERLPQLASAYALESLGAAVRPIQGELVASLKDARESGDQMMERPLISALSRLGVHALEYPETIELMKESLQRHGRVFGSVLIGSLQEAGREHLPFLFDQIRAADPLERLAALAPIGIVSKGSELREREALQELLEGEILYDDDSLVCSRGLLLASNLAETTGLFQQEVTTAGCEALLAADDDVVEAGVLVTGRFPEYSEDALHSLLEILEEEGRHHIRAQALLSLSAICFEHEIEFEFLPEVASVLQSEENPKVIEDVIRALYEDDDRESDFGDPEF